MGGGWHSRQLSCTLDGVDCQVGGSTREKERAVAAQHKGAEVHKKALACTGPPARCCSGARGLARSGAAGGGPTLTPPPGGTAVRTKKRTSEKADIRKGDVSQKEEVQEQELQEDN